MVNWYAVYTQPGKEKVAARNLANQEFEIYLPLYRKQRRHARRVDSILAPLFMRYLFIRLDPARQRWRSVNGTFGVSYLLTDGAAPTVIPTSLIEAIRTRESEGVVNICPAAIKKGQRLRVIEGPFNSIEGIVECVDDRERVTLLLNFMGQCVRAHLPTSAVSAA